MKRTLFTSSREKRLWIITGVVVIGIYSTLGLAARLVGLIENQTLSAVFFLLGMLLAGISILSLALNYRLRGIEIGAVVGVSLVYLFAFFRMTIPERTHLIEYSVVAGLIFEALKERESQGRNVPMPALLAVLAAAAVGVLDEGIQFFLPRRVFDPVDILFNSLAAGMAVAGMVILRWIRKSRIQKREKEQE